MGRPPERLLLLVAWPASLVLVAGASWWLARRDARPDAIGAPDDPRDPSPRNPLQLAENEGEQESLTGAAPGMATPAREAERATPGASAYTSLPGNPVASPAIELPHLARLRQIPVGRSQVRDRELAMHGYPCGDAVLRGQVSDRAGRPIPDAVVFLIMADVRQGIPTGPYRGGPGQVRTDPEGRYEISRLPDASRNSPPGLPWFVGCAVWDAGGACCATVQRVVIPREGAITSDFAMPAGGAGRLIGAVRLHGVELGRVDVTLRGDLGHAMDYRRDLRLAADGGFEVTALPPGIYGLSMMWRDPPRDGWVCLPGFGPFRVESEILRVDGDIVLGSVELRLRDEAGRPQSGSRSLRGIDPEGTDHGHIAELWASEDGVARGLLPVGWNVWLDEGDAEPRPVRVVAGAVTLMESVEPRMPPEPRRDG